MINTIFSMGLVNSAAELASDSSHAVENANNATNLKLPKRQRKQARKDFIKNMVNVGAPIAVGAALGATSYGTAAIPAAQMTQSLVKASGIGTVMGEIFQPLLAPFTNILGLFKQKIKEHLKLDIGKWVGRGTKITNPVADTAKKVTANPLAGMMDATLFTGSPSATGLGVLGSVLENKRKAYTPSATHVLSRKGNKPKVSSFMPNFEPTRRYTRGF